MQHAVRAVVPSGTASCVLGCTECKHMHRAGLKPVLCTRSSFRFRSIPRFRLSKTKRRRFKCIERKREQRRKKITLANETTTKEPKTAKTRNARKTPSRAVFLQYFRFRLSDENGVLKERQTNKPNLGTSAPKIPEMLIVRRAPLLFYIP